VIAAGGEQAHVFHALASLKGAPGRMDLVGQTQDGASVFVDYAHTPDAVATALLALRPTARGKLVVVLGCGGDRDKGKRPLMAKAAADHADKVIITDDNPRSEDPAMIRRDALAGAPSAMEIGDRATAIRSAVDMLKTGDILLVAGKGHELGQTIGAETRPFSDHDAVRAALAGEEYHAA
jgi:UDP-N-acetylmuramoyl-L-alanyl-D-glutamate--2,6-diaminopimelate ligase